MFGCFGSQGHYHLEIIQAVPQVCASVLFQFVMRRPGTETASLRFFRLWPFHRISEIVGHRSRRCVTMFQSSIASLDKLGGLKQRE